MVPVAPNTRITRVPQAIGRFVDESQRLDPNARGALNRVLDPYAWMFHPIRYFFRMADTSSEILTLSPTNKLPLPSAWLNFMSKSLRFRNP